VDGREPMEALKMNNEELAAAKTELCNWHWVDDESSVGDAIKTLMIAGAEVVIDEFHQEFSDNAAVIEIRDEKIWLFTHAGDHFRVDLNVTESIESYLRDEGPEGRERLASMLDQLAAKLRAI
jgi:hypothetical protein